MKHTFFAFFLLMFLFVGVGDVHALSNKTTLKVAGWIPYWAVEDGTQSALTNLSKLDEIYPFVFTVKDDGSLKDLGKLEKPEWQTLFTVARQKKVAVIPTITSGDGAAIHTILSNTQLRNAHVAAIAQMVKDGNYSGVDIDYENRSKDTIMYFSLFLAQLKLKMGMDKKLVCTLEPRTPPDSLWKVVPNPLPYSNDYSILKRLCDVVQIMAYDQQRADLKLNDSKSGEPYYPNADIDWVEKVVSLTTLTMPKEKIMLGIPTYGRHVIVTVSPNWYQEYSNIGAISSADALDLAKEYDVEPSKNKAGEQSFTYIPKGTSDSVSQAISAMRVPKGTTPGMKVAVQALAYANQTGDSVLINMVWWSDVQAIADKIAFAKKRHLRGVAVFKVDGKEDQNIWKLF